MNVMDSAWAAGFFDGEGTVGIYKRNTGYYRLELNVVNCDLRPLKRLKLLWGGSISTVNRKAAKSGHRLAYRWRPNTVVQLQKFINDIYDHSTVKVDELYIAREYMSLDGRKVKKDNQEYVQAMRALKRRVF